VQSSTTQRPSLIIFLLQSLYIDDEGRAMPTSTDEETTSANGIPCRRPALLNERRFQVGASCRISIHIPMTPSVPWYVDRFIHSVPLARKIKTDSGSGIECNTWQCHRVHGHCTDAFLVLMKEWREGCLFEVCLRRYDKSFCPRTRMICASLVLIPWSPHFSASVSS
jgi:hypothetical protein